MYYYDTEKSGKRIKELRNAYGMKQEEIAEQIGIAQSTYARIESGKKGASIDTLTALVEVFGTTLDYIVLGKEESKANLFPKGYPEEKRKMALKIWKGIMDNL